MDAADNAAFLHWDSELFGAVATAGTATQKRRVLVIGARDPALLHALAKAGLGLVVLEVWQYGFFVWAVSTTYFGTLCGDFFF
jgi:hypothetical protein